MRASSRARAYVIAISDPASTRRSVRVARELAPGVRIFVRTEYVSEVDELEALGADEVVPEEFETALSLFDRVLGIYDMPRGDDRRPGSRGCGWRTTDS